MTPLKHDREALLTSRGHKLISASPHHVRNLNATTILVRGVMESFLEESRFSSKEDPRAAANPRDSASRLLSKHLSIPEKGSLQPKRPQKWARRARAMANRTFAKRPQKTNMAPRARATAQTSRSGGAKPVAHPCGIVFALSQYSISRNLLGDLGNLLAT